jgi:hypothetical protein
MAAGAVLSQVKIITARVNTQGEGGKSMIYFKTVKQNPSVKF